jgi:hypothetical protein
MRRRRNEDIAAVPARRQVARCQRHARTPDLAEDDGARLVLLEDFGESRMRDYLDQWPDDEARSIVPP